MSFEINSGNIIEKFVRSSGKGGQNVNKVSTCVFLKHIPSGVTVKCETYRSQNKNRILAYKILAEKLENMENLKISSIRGEIEKLRRQKRKRPKSLQEEILREKKIKSEKKMLRKRIF
jgi:peptide chain release factor